MRRFALSLLLVAACGRSNFDDAGTDSISGGEMIDNRDHDADGIFDSVDNCPQAFNQNQMDVDADGVGDACDPRPAMAGDTLVALGLFSTSFGDWVPDVATNWELAGGILLTSGVQDTTDARLSLTTVARQPTVQLSFVVEDYGVYSPDEQVNIRIAAGADNWWCHTLGASTRINTIALHKNAQYQSGTSIISVAPRATNQMLVTWSASDITCSLNGQPAGNASTPMANPQVTVSIEVANLKAGLRYAALYAIP